jgi:hypothetical protein
MLDVFVGATLSAYVIATHIEPRALAYMLASSFWISVSLVPSLPAAFLKRPWVCCAQSLFSLVQALFGTLVLVGQGA